MVIIAHYTKENNADGKNGMAKTFVEAQSPRAVRGPGLVVTKEQIQDTLRNHVLTSEETTTLGDTLPHLATLCHEAILIALKPRQFNADRESCIALSKIKFSKILREHYGTGHENSESLKILENIYTRLIDRIAEVARTNTTAPTTSRSLH